jgi:hypothetical protein
MTPRPPRFEIKVYAFNQRWCWQLWDRTFPVEKMMIATSDFTYASRAAALRAGRREIRRTK